MAGIDVPSNLHPYLIKSVIIGDKMMLSTQLKLLKEKRKLTNQQLSDLSGVPVGTINRILSGQTDNPSFQTVCDMVMAMDGSLDELVGIQQEIPQAEKKARASKTFARAARCCSPPDRS